MDKLPKIILRALFLLKALDIREAITLARQVVYLYREFYIKTRLEPVIKEFIVEFKYKDETLTSCRITDIKDLIKLIDKIKSNRAMKGKDID
jgi:hypothetical protein